MTDRAVRPRTPPTPCRRRDPKAASAACLALLLSAATLAGAPQTRPVDRLPASVLDVVPPSARVNGPPGSMRASRTGCQSGAVSLDAGLRRRIVDIAVQEWAFFGFTVVDQTNVEQPSAAAPSTPPPAFGRSRFGRLPEAEAARVAATIAGYWTVTPEGPWVIDQQNAEWKGRAGIAARWRSPWSAAFISWVMCASGLSDAGTFQRAVAHHRYIDQAIRARDGAAPEAAFVAYDAGEAPIAPGDLLCSGRRPAYVRLAERRTQMGEGARTHCDIVVQVDVERRRILAIGGNVRSRVSLKVLPAEPAGGGSLRPFDFSDVELDDNPYRGARPVFAHLKLRAGAIDTDALDRSLIIRTLECSANTGSTPLPAGVTRLLGRISDSC